jgi:subtilisin family serine protease
MACMHGTFVAGILSAKRGGIAPAIAPNCTLVVRSIFAETTRDGGNVPSATPEELATAIIETIDAGARVLNLSAALEPPSGRAERGVELALDEAARRQVLVVAAAGNQGIVGGSVITRHQWVLPVIACDRRGTPTAQSNLSRSVGRNGLAAPGEGITSLGITGEPYTFGGTSVAAPFVTAAIALAWSELPMVTAAEMKFAITHAHMMKRSTVVPPLLNAWAAYQLLMRKHGRKSME